MWFITLNAEPKKPEVEEVVGGDRCLHRLGKPDAFLTGNLCCG